MLQGNSRQNVFLLLVLTLAELRKQLGKILLVKRGNTGGQMPKLDAELWRCTKCHSVYSKVLRRCTGWNFSQGGCKNTSFERGHYFFREPRHEPNVGDRGCWHWHPVPKGTERTCCKC